MKKDQLEMLDKMQSQYEGLSWLADISEEELRDRTINLLIEEASENGARRAYMKIASLCLAEINKAERTR